MTTDVETVRDAVPLRPDAEILTFGHLEISFDERILRPRPWTVEQAEWGADLLKLLPEGPVLEMCCGAGHIGLLAIAQTDRSLVAVDLDPAAVAFAAHNAAAAGLCSRVEVRNADVDEALGEGEQFALIIADPPWVPRCLIASFPDDPRRAIDGGGDGLDVARHCISTAERHLSPGGVLLLQLGTMAQVARVTDFTSCGPLQVSEVRDVPGSGVLVRLDRMDAPWPPIVG